MPSIEELEFNLDKRIALFENRLDMQVAILQTKYDELIISDIQLAINAKAKFIIESLKLMVERDKLSQLKYIDKNHYCPACGGDGIETCSNPDHGYYFMVGCLVSANESACPCCGHDPEHKIKRWVNGHFEYQKCFECDGLGRVTESDCERITDEYGIDQPTEDFLC